MTPADVLHLLREQYGKQGELYPLTDVQIATYMDRWQKIDPVALNAAALRWIDTSRFFPAVSDLLGMFAVSEKAEAELAWAVFERLLRQVGVYHGVKFAGNASRLGETVRQVFGSWVQACQYETDSAGWHGRKQAFLALYPVVQVDTAVTLGGLHEGKPVVCGAIQGIPDRPALPPANKSLTRSEAKELLGTLQKRLKG